MSSRFAREPQLSGLSRRAKADHQLVVKSRLQAATHKYKSSITAVLQILKTEGLSGLYAGIGPKLLQSALTAAFMFVAQRRIFELVKSLVVAAQQKKAASLRA